MNQSPAFGCRMLLQTIAGGATAFTVSGLFAEELLRTLSLTEGPAEGQPATACRAADRTARTLVDMPAGGKSYTVSVFASMPAPHPKPRKWLIPRSY